MAAEDEAAQTPSGEEASSDGASNGEPSFLKGAARVATLGAIVGAAFGVARAMTKSQPDDRERETEEPEVDARPQAEDHAGERGGGNRDDVEATEPVAREHEYDEPDEDEEEKDQAPDFEADTEREPSDELDDDEGPDLEADGGREPSDELDDAESEAEEADSGSRRRSEDRDGAGRAEHDEPSRDGAAAISVIRRAREQLAEVTGRAPEAVLGLEKRDDGWLVTLEVLELERIPSSTDVLAAYEAHLGADGELLEYTRKARYHRGRTGGEEES